MMNSKLLRQRRHGFTTQQAADDAKFTDTTPSTHGAPELVKTITITPAANQYVITTKTSGDVSLDGIEAVQNHAILWVKIVGFHNNLEQLASRDNDLVAPLGCTNNVFSNGSRVETYTAPIGEAVVVEFYLSVFNIQALSVCTRNDRVDYSLVTVTRHGQV